MDSISFDALVSLLPVLPIEVLKVDMQAAGHGRLFLTSLPDSILARTSRITFEAISPSCTPLYHGQMTCDKIETFLVAKGFRGKCGRGCEITPTFHRDAAA